MSKFAKIIEYAVAVCDAEERWITVGGGTNAETGQGTGRHFKIDGEGRILAGGSAEMKGKTLKEAFSEPKTERQKIGRKFAEAGAKKFGGDERQYRNLGTKKGQADSFAREYLKSGNVPDGHLRDAVSEKETSKQIMQKKREKFRENKEIDIEKDLLQINNNIERNKQKTQKKLEDSFKKATPATKEEIESAQTKPIQEQKKIDFSDEQKSILAKAKDIIIRGIHVPHEKSQQVGGGSFNSARHSLFKNALKKAEETGDFTELNKRMQPILHSEEPDPLKGLKKLADEYGEKQKPADSDNETNFANIGQDIELKRNTHKPADDAAANGGQNSKTTLPAKRDKINQEIEKSQLERNEKMTLLLQKRKQFQRGKSEPPVIGEAVTIGDNYAGCSLGQQGVVTAINGAYVEIYFGKTQDGKKIIRRDFPVSLLEKRNLSKEDKNNLAHALSEYAFADGHGGDMYRDYPNLNLKDFDKLRKEARVPNPKIEPPELDNQALQGLKDLAKEYGQQKQADNIKNKKSIEEALSEIKGTANGRFSTDLLKNLEKRALEGDKFAEKEAINQRSSLLYNLQRREWITKGGEGELSDFMQNKSELSHIDYREPFFYKEPTTPALSGLKALAEEYGANNNLQANKETATLSSSSQNEINNKNEDSIMSKSKKISKNLVKSAHPDRFKQDYVIGQGQNYLLKDIYFSENPNGALDKVISGVYIHSVENTTTPGLSSPSQNETNNNNEGSKMSILENDSVKKAISDFAKTPKKHSQKAFQELNFFLGTVGKNYTNQEKEQIRDAAIEAAINKTAKPKKEKEVIKHDLSAIDIILDEDRRIKSTTGMQGAKLSESEVRFINDIKNKSKLTEKQASWLRSIGRRFNKSFYDINVAKPKATRVKQPQYEEEPDMPMQREDGSWYDAETGLDITNPKYMKSYL